MSKRVLVVGGAGYVGGAVTDRLRAVGHDVRVYDSLLWEDQYRKPISFIRGDIRDHDLLGEHLAWADAVIWLAALVADGACSRYPELGWELNDRCVAWLAQHYDGRVVFPSSSLVYAMASAPLTEDAPLDPKTIYTQSKRNAEQHLAAANACVFRFATLFGIGDGISRFRSDLVVNGMTGRATATGKMTVHGGMQSRAFCHVADAARAVADAVDHTHRGIYNLASENSTILALAERIRTHIPEATIAVTPADRAATGDYQLDATKAATVLGWSPAQTLDDGICEVRDFVRSGAIANIDDPKYSNDAFLTARPLPEVFLEQRN